MNPIQHVLNDIFARLRIPFESSHKTRNVNMQMYVENRNFFSLLFSFHIYTYYTHSTPLYENIFRNIEKQVQELAVVVHHMGKKL